MKFVAMHQHLLTVFMCFVTLILYVIYQFILFFFRNLNEMWGISYIHVNLMLIWKKVLFEVLEVIVSYLKCMFSVLILSLSCMFKKSFHEKE
jgi:hypothetical protein